MMKPRIVTPKPKRMRILPFVFRGDGASVIRPPEGYFEGDPSNFYPGWRRYQPQYTPFESELELSYGYQRSYQSHLGRIVNQSHHRNLCRSQRASNCLPSGRCNLFVRQSYPE